MPVAEASGKPAVAASNPDEFFGESTIADQQGKYELRLHRIWNLPSTNKNGTTGWATVLQTTNPKLNVDDVRRFHKCAFNPCRAVWDRSKYGQFSVPIHVQTYVPSCTAEATLIHQPIAAVAGWDGPELPPAAVAGVASIEQPVAAVAETSAPPELELPNIDAAAEPDAISQPPLPPPPEFPPPKIIEQVVAPPAPDVAGRLLGIQPPLPASPTQRIDEHVQEPAPPAASSAVAAWNAVSRSLLFLAREIRRPRSYVGYSAFVLMALRENARPFAWEGSTSIDLIGTYAPWASEDCTAQCAVQVVCCALKAQPTGHAQLCAISEELPLSTCRHFVAAVTAPEAAVAESAVAASSYGASEFERLYQSLGVVVLGSIIDGDCGLDVMTMMLSLPQTFEARKKLRIDISDYLIARVEEPWMHHLMVACGELSAEDVSLLRSSTSAIADLPTAVADVAPDCEVLVEDLEPAKTSEETVLALRWATDLRDDAHLLKLIDDLPPEIVKEQVGLYNEHKSKPVATALPSKPVVTDNSTYNARMIVAKAFHTYCANKGYDPHRLPRQAMQTFINDHVDWRRKCNKKVSCQSIRRWYKGWSKTPSHLLAAVAGETKNKNPTRKQSGIRMVETLARRRGVGAGRKRKAETIGKELYDWWVGLRYAIDWKELVKGRRSRGKKCMARFPRHILLAKAMQLLEDHAYASLLNGVNVESFQPTSHWFKTWENDHGLSMRKANRKYEVPRAVLKDRLEIGWLNTHRLRKLCILLKGYDPIIENSDQSPYHNNETGSQNKPILGVRGSKIPCIEGKNDVRTRWTANLTTFSDTARILRGEMPHTQLMFKGETDAALHERLQTYARSRGFPDWFSVTTSPKGSYREHDVVAFLDKHLEKMTPDRDWRIFQLDDYSAHKMESVRRLAWSRGYVLSPHGGGATPFVQTPDTDLNEHVRREYGVLETRLLIDKMRDGIVVPKASQPECMEMMFQVLSDPGVHLRAQQGYLKTGWTVAMDGAQDFEICREAATFWNEETTDGFANMRAKIDAELSAVAEEVASGGLKWCRRDVERLVSPYKKCHVADKILERMGDEYYHDAVHRDNEDENPAVAGNIEDAANASDDSDSDDRDSDDLAAHCAAVAASDETNVVLPEITLSEEQADAVHSIKMKMTALKDSIEECSRVGAVKAVQCLERELAIEQRMERALARQSPAVAESFLLRRKAEAQELARKRRLADELNQHALAAKKAKAECAAAVAELKKHKAAIQEYENIRETRHAMKTFTIESLGQGHANAGGPAARKRRFEVLDRMGRIGAGLSPGQKNDWQWFKESWDAAMVVEHRAEWGLHFTGWMQRILDDEVTNAFSVFVYNETCRIFKGAAALHVP